MYRVYKCAPCVCVGLQSRRNNLESILELLVFPLAAVTHSMELSDAQLDEALRSQDPLCAGRLPPAWRDSIVCTVCCLRTAAALSTISDKRMFV